jgi:D-aspartate ligase
VIVSVARSRAGLAAIRALGRGGFEVVAADYARPPLGLRSRWAAGHLQMPPPEAGSGLAEVLESARVRAILPMESPLVGFCAAHRERLRRVMGVAVPEPAGFLEAFDNRRTLAACARLGIPAPRLLERIATDGMVVVKPRADIGAARGVAFCRGRAEVERALLACRPFGVPLVQEFIPGGPEAMRTVVVLFDRRSRLVAHFTTRKLRELPATGGMTTMSVSTDDRALVELVLPLFAAWRWEGPAEVELKIDARDGRAKLIEVNPRLPAYLPFAIRCGLHLPRLCVLVAMGESPQAGSYAVGRTFVNPILHLKALLAGGQPLRAFGRALNDMRGAYLGDGLDWADPAPRLAKAIARLRRRRTGSSAVDVAPCVGDVRPGGVDP